MTSKATNVAALRRQATLDRGEVGAAVSVKDDDVESRAARALESPPRWIEFGKHSLPVGAGPGAERPLAASGGKLAANADGFDVELSTLGLLGRRALARHRRQGTEGEVLGDASEHAASAYGAGSPPAQRAERLPERCGESAVEVVDLGG